MISRPQTPASPSPESQPPKPQAAGPRPAGSSSGTPNVIEVSLGDRSYPIEVGTGVLGSIGGRIGERLGDVSHVMVIVDEAVADRWGNVVESSLGRVGIRHDRFVVPSGETSKSMQQLANVWRAMLEAGADRRSVVIAVGGGVAGDLAGFAAASFARGIRLVQVPTTLLAMVDSSVGGKTGINLPNAKNMVGAFWQPSCVAIDTETLSTLPDREFLSGMAEVIKYGVIDDAEFFAWLEQNAGKLVAREPDPLREAIRRSCESKARVVGEDERETIGRRAILNYGHTFAHALEATTGYGTLLHGEAVAIGMQMAARLAIGLRLCDEELLDRQTALLRGVGLPIVYPNAAADGMLPVMSRDKKVEHGKLRFILPTEIGSVRLVGDVDDSHVRRAIEQTRET